MTGAIVISGLAEVLTAFCPFDPGMGLKPPPECVEAVPFVTATHIAHRAGATQAADEGLPDNARHAVRRILRPRVLNLTTSYNVASNICQARCPPRR